MIVNPGAGGGTGGAAAKHAAQHAVGGTDPLTPASIGAADASHTHSAADTGAIPADRKVNGKPLTEDISLTASDVGARPDDWLPTAAEIGAAASGHTHTPEEIGAARADHTHTAAEVGARPDNWLPKPGEIGAAAADHEHSGYAAASHTHTPASIGAAEADHTHTPASIGAAAANHSHSGYASSSHSHTAAEVGALPLAGGTITGDLTLKGSGNYGNKLNFGDGDYVHLYEKEDDCLEIKAKKINFLLSDTSSSNLTVNGSPIGGGGTVTSITGNAGSATKLQTARTIDGVDFDGSAAISHYGVCSTAAATAAKTVSCTGFKLVTGARIAVKFTYTNTAATATLNVNGTGAKSIVSHGTINGINTYGNAWQAGELIEFIYDGTNFVMVDGNIRLEAHNAVPKSYKINGKSLDSSNTVLTMADIAEIQQVSFGAKVSKYVDLELGGVFLICVHGCYPLVYVASASDTSSANIFTTSSTTSHVIDISWNSVTGNKLRVYMTNATSQLRDVTIVRLK